MVAPAVAATTGAGHAVVAATAAVAFAVALQEVFVAVRQEAGGADHRAVVVIADHLAAVLIRVVF